MSHDQSHGTDNLKTAFFLNLFFTIVEIIGGFYTNSIAILSDALHDGGDCLSLGASWYLQKVSKRDSSSHFTYGYQRFSPLGGLITGTVLSIGMVVILFKAIPRLLDPQPVQASGMIGLAVLGIAVNGFAAWRASRGSSLNEGIVSWHLLEDVLGWIAVLIGSIAMKIWDVPIIDPILSILISIFILINVIRNLSSVAKVFMQRTPEGFDTEIFSEKALAVDGVKDVHHTHSWTLDGEAHVLTTHLVMGNQSSREAVVEAKKKVVALLSDFEFQHITIEVELEDEECCLTEESEHAHEQKDD